MTISNGSTIAVADLNAVSSSSLTSLQADNAAVPAVYWMNLNFNALTSSTPTIARTRNVVMPDNYLLREIVLAAGEHSGTITLTIDNGALIETISMAGVMSSGFVEATRYYVSKPIQVFLKGSIVTVTASTTATGATSTVQVALGFDTEWRRS